MEVKKKCLEAAAARPWCWCRGLAPPFTHSPVFLHWLTSLSKHSLLFLNTVLSKLPLHELANNSTLSHLYSQAKLTLGSHSLGQELTRTGTGSFLLAGTLFIDILPHCPISFCRISLVPQVAQSSSLHSAPPSPLPQADAAGGKEEIYC